MFLPQFAKNVGFMNLKYLELVGCWTIDRIGRSRILSQNLVLQGGLCSAGHVVEVSQLGWQL